MDKKKLQELAGVVTRVEELPITEGLITAIIEEVEKHATHVIEKYEDLSEEAQVALDGAYADVDPALTTLGESPYAMINRVEQWLRTQQGAGQTLKAKK